MAAEDADSNEVFRRSTMNRIASADELDHYIKVTNPSAWIVALAALLLVGGVFIWAFTAIVPVTIETTGVLLVADDSQDTKVQCIVDKKTSERIKESDAQASIEGIPAKSVEMNDMPLSASEVYSRLGSDFYADSITVNDWNYLVTIIPTEQPKHSSFEIKSNTLQGYLVPVSIIVSETQPINIVMGDRS